MNPKSKPSYDVSPAYRERLRALSIFCYAGWSLTLPFLFLAWWIYSMGYPISLEIIYYLGVGLFLFCALHWILPRWSATRHLIDFWCLTFSVGISVIETMIIFFTGGVLSPFIWVYLISICGETYFLSPRRGVQVAAFDCFLFVSMVILQVFEKLPRIYSLVADFDPYSSPPFLVTHVLSYLVLYIAGAAIFAALVHQVRVAKIKLSDINAQLKTNEVKVSDLLIGSQKREDELKDANKELLKVRAALFNIMDDIEDANKKLTRRTEELEAKKTQLEAMTSDLIKQRTELLTMTRALERANLELIEFDRTKSDFATLISQELQKPLIVSRKMVVKLKEEGQEQISKERSERLREIGQDLGRMRVVIDHILHLFRLESGQTKIHKCAMQIPDVVKEVVHQLEPDAGEKRIKLEVDMPDSLPSVYADREYVSYVIRYLIENGIEFNRKKGFVRVSASYDSSSDCVEVIVADNGIGIAPDDMGRIFGKFRKIVEPGREYVGGSGLGLYISSLIIDEHHGRIWADSEPNKGSKFHFALPVFHAELLVEGELDSVLEETRMKGLTVVIFALEMKDADRILASCKEIKHDEFYRCVEKELVGCLAPHKGRVYMDADKHQFYVVAFSPFEEARKTQGSLIGCLQNIKVPLAQQKVKLQFKISSVIFPFDGLERKVLLERLVKGLEG